MEKSIAEKIIGYTLLVIGLVIIAYAALDAINVFTGKSVPFNLFTFQSISIDLGKLTNQSLPPGTDLKQDLFEADLLNKPMNLTAHLLLMGFVASVGFKVATLGIMLARPIKVHLIGKNLPETKQ
jgi:hypothetical protein